MSKIETFKVSNMSVVARLSGRGNVVCSVQRHTASQRTKREILRVAAELFGADRRVLIRVES